MQRIKRQQAKQKHLRQKRRARYMKVFNELRRNSIDMYADFDLLVQRLQALHVKYLQVMVEDLEKNGYIPPWSGDYHRRLIDAAHTKIVESTIFKD